jgi:hypothetical protein
MERAATLVDETAVGHFVGQGMLEGIPRIGEQGRLIQELGPLKSGQGPAKPLVGEVGNGLEEGEGYVLADRGGASSVFSSASSRSIRAARTACTVGGTRMLAGAFVIL